METKKLVGDLAERKACHFLIKKGLKLLETQYRSRFGEIDLIMQDHKQAQLVFVEVRYRSHTQYGDAVESVSLKKQMKIIKTAQYYLQTKQLIDTIACRFDVIGFSKTNKMTWIQDAFQVQ